MSWLSQIAGALPFLRNPESLPGQALHRELRARGATRELVRYAKGFHRDVERAWAECPRADWAIEMAARGDLRPRLIGDAIRDLTVGHSVDPRADEPAFAAAPEGTSAHWIRQGLAAADGYEGREIDALVDTVAAMTHALVEALPEVRAAHAEVEEAQRWGRLREMVSASDAFDDAHARGHVELCDRVRKRIPKDLLRRAYGRATGHPYR